MKNLLNDKTKQLISDVTAIITGGLTDAIGVIGLLLLCYGFGQIYPPLMYIVAGAVLIFIALATSGSKSGNVQQVD